jgi:hypothetical protein
MNEPRLLNSLYHAYFEQEFYFLYKNKKNVEEIAEKYKNCFSFKCSYLNKNKFFNLNEFVFHTLIMIYISKNTNKAKSIFECFSSVLEIEDPEQMQCISNELAVFLTHKQ